LADDASERPDAQLSVAWCQRPQIGRYFLSEQRFTGWAYPLLLAQARARIRVRRGDNHANNLTQKARTRLTEDAGPLRRSYVVGVPVEQVRNGIDKLRYRKRPFQEDAVGHAVRGPLIGADAGDVDDGETRINLSGAPSDVPTVHLI
jgi:hypothetical protein